MNQKEKARIVESAEAAYLAATFAAAPADVAAELGMTVFQMWGGVAAIMANDPSGGFWSRTLGIGIDRPISTDFLEAIDSLYLANGGKSIYCRSARSLSRLIGKIWWRRPAIPVGGPG